MADTNQEQEVVRITPRAREHLAALRMQDPEGPRLALWLAVTGIDAGRYTYEMVFRHLSEAQPDDAVRSDDELPVVIPASSASKLRGATIDFEGEPPAATLSIDNPNRPSALGMLLPVVPSSPAGQGPTGAHAGHAHEQPSSPAVGAHATGELTGPVAERVAQVLDQAINPQIASHGGRAELAGVEGDTAYLRLSGGCQGCGMATVTLSQGIKVAITEAVPEIRNVVDVTDHASGTNPFFEPAKK